MTKYFFICFVLVFMRNSINAQEEKDKSIKTLTKTLTQASSALDRANALLNLAVAYVYKPGEEKADLDTALLLIRQAEVSNTRNLHNKFIEAKAYFAYSNAYREKGERETGQSYITKSIEILNQIPVTDDLGEAYLEASQYYSFETSSLTKSKMDLYEKAAWVFEKTKNTDREAFALKNVADLKQIDGHYIEALSDLKKAISICSDSHPDTQEGIFDLLNDVYIKIGDNARAVDYGLKAVRLVEKYNDTSLQVATIYNRLATAYHNWNNDEEATMFFQKAFDIAEKYNNNDYILGIFPSVCTGLQMQGRWKQSVKFIQSIEARIKPADWYSAITIYDAYVYAYMAGEQYSQAGKYADKLLPIVDSSERYDQSLIYVYRCLTEYYIAAKQYRQADKYADRLLVTSKESNTPRYISVAYRFKSSVDSALGNYHSALLNYHIHRQMKDSMINQAKSLQFAEMDIEFKTEKTQNELKLNQQKVQSLRIVTKLQQESLRQAGIIRNIITGAFLLAIILFYIGFRFKQKSNQKLQAKQTEINQRNQELTKTITEKNTLLEDKEWLLKEVHHRVKNNLQIVISLLNTQSRFLNNKEALDAIQESRHRMQAMSLIHQKLYQGESSAYVNMKVYVEELSDYLKTSFSIGTCIRFIIDICSIELDISQAIPIGLILNEAITNSIKYAFPNRENGNIKIAMQVYDDDLRLHISDDGIGLPSGFDIDNSESMGMRLIRGLIRQLDGSIHFDSKGGTNIWIRFTFDHKLKSISAPESSHHRQLALA